MTSVDVPFIPYPEITQEQLRAYAEASGDPNEIHLNEEVARRMGLPGVIAHGMLLAGMMAERAQRFVEEELPGNGQSGFELRSFQTRFKAMTFLGDRIEIGGSIKTRTEAEVCLDLQARKQDGAVVTSGTARFTREG